MGKDKTTFATMGIITALAVTGGSATFGVVANNNLQKQIQENEELKQTNITIKAENTTLKKDKTSLQNNLTTTQNALDLAETRLLNIETELEDKTTRLAEVEEELATSESNNETLKNEKLELQNDIATLTNEKTTLNIQVTSLNTTIEELNARITELEANQGVSISESLCGIYTIHITSLEDSNNPMGFTPYDAFVRVNEDKTVDIKISAFEGAMGGSVYEKYGVTTLNTYGDTISIDATLDIPLLSKLEGFTVTLIPSLNDEEIYYSNVSGTRLNKISKITGPTGIEFEFDDFVTGEW